MSEEPDLAGDAEPDVLDGDNCANCGELLQGAFCSACGQEKRSLTGVSLRHLLNDWLGDVFTFDSRLFRTLSPLIAKPGFLTQEYLAGRRVRFVPPLRLFVFFSLVMFLVLGLTDVEFSWNLTSEGEQIAASGRHAEKLRAEPETTETAEKTGSEKPTEKSDGVAETEAGAQGKDTGRRDILDDPAEINRRILERLPQAMFLLVPVLGLMLWLLHRRRLPFYVPHLIFSLHVHCFWFLVITAGALLNLALSRDEPSKLLGLIAFVPYLYLAQRRVYGGGRLANLLRTGFLVAAQLLALMFMFFGLLLLTVIDL